MSGTPMMSPAAEAVVSNDGTRIAYETSGRGPALVLVSGAMGYKDFPYLHKLAEFAKDFRVYSPDRRGRGGSGDEAVQRRQGDRRSQAVCREAGGDRLWSGFPPALRWLSKPQPVGCQ